MNVQSAVDVAAQAGLVLCQKNGKHWARCPLHREQTASMCFYPDGHFYCFGCHAHGDAADLFAALHGVSLRKALQAVNGGDWTPIQRKPPSGVELRQKVESWKAECWRKACQRKHLWARFITLAEKNNTPETLMLMDQFYESLAEYAKAEDELNILQKASPVELLTMLRRSKDECQRI